MKFELRKEEKEGNKTQACARAPGSSLTRNISLPKSLAGWPMRTPTNPSLMAASTGDSSGIWPFTTPAGRAFHVIDRQPGRNTFHVAQYNRQRRSRPPARRPRHLRKIRCSPSIVTMVPFLTRRSKLIACFSVCACWRTENKRLRMKIIIGAQRLRN